MLLRMTKLSRILVTAGRRPLEPVPDGAAHASVGVREPRGNYVRAKALEGAKRVEETAGVVLRRVEEDAQFQVDCSVA